MIEQMMQGKTIAIAKMEREDGQNILMLELNDGTVCEITGSDYGAAVCFSSTTPEAPKPQTVEDAWLDWKKEAPEPTYEELQIVLAYMMGNPGEYFQRKRDGTLACYHDIHDEQDDCTDTVPANVLDIADRFINTMTKED